MPVNPTYPGVYIQELPSGQRSIAGVSTSVAAFVGRFERGPADVPVQVFNVGDLERRFGGLRADAETGYAVRQFFLNGGSQAWIVRVAPGGAAASVVMQTVADAADPSLRAVAGQLVGEDTAENPGTWGNGLRLDVDFATLDPERQFNLAVSEIRIEDGREVVVRTEEFRNLSMEEDATDFAIPVVNNASRLVYLDRGDAEESTWELVRPAPTGTTSGDVLPATLSPDAVDSTIEMTIGAEAAVEVAIAADALPTTPAEARARLETAIRAAAPTDPRFARATVRLDAGRLRVLLGRTGENHDPDAIVTFADAAAGGNLAGTLLLTNAGPTPAIENVQQYRFGSPETPAGVVGFRGVSQAGADDVIGPGDVGDLADALRGERGGKTGLYALEDADLFNILAVPEAAALDAAGSVTNLSQVMAAAIDYCEERRAMVLIDPPPGVRSLEAALAFVDDLAGASLRHRNAAAYFPRLRIPDPLDDNRLRSFAPSGTIAGVWARTDGARGVWKAPAGIEASLRGVVELGYRLSDPENGQLNPLGLNCLRTFDNIGTVSWGARTLRGADVFSSDWKYVPVRRLALFVEESLFRGLQFAVFEPNDEPLWAEIRTAAGSFMQRLFRQGAFQGATPREAYLVKCDAETTTEADRAAGIVNVLVGFAPLRPAEFVIVSLRLLAGQAES